MEKFALLHQYSDTGLFLLRAVIALIFLVHGIWKIFNGRQMAENADMQGSGWFFVILGVIECAGALVLLAGLFTQAAAALLGLIMIGAIYFKIVNWKVHFTAHDKTGWEFDLLILAACTYIVFEGAGRIALDRTLFSLY